MGDPGVGLLTAAIGLGGLVGATMAIGLAGRRNLAPWFAAGMVAWGGGIGLVGIVPLPVAALSALAVAGVGKMFVDSVGFSAHPAVAAERHAHAHPRHPGGPDRGGDRPRSGDRLGPHRHDRDRVRRWSSSDLHAHRGDRARLAAGQRRRSSASRARPGAAPARCAAVVPATPARHEAGAGGGHDATNDRAGRSDLHAGRSGRPLLHHRERRGRGGGRPPHRRAASAPATPSARSRCCGTCHGRPRSGP